MKASEFVKRLPDIAPDSKDLVRRSLSEDYIRQLVDSYHAAPRPEKHEYENELLNLIYNYDSSAIEITLIHFDLKNDSPYGVPPTERFVRVAWAEADFVVIDKETGEIALEDHEVGGRI